jgi:hypothetical protein
LTVRDLALAVIEAGGVEIAPGLHRYVDNRLEITYCPAGPSTPHTLQIAKLSPRPVVVFSAVWPANGDDAVVLMHRAGSWEDSLKRLVAVPNGAPSCWILSTR